MYRLRKARVARAPFAASPPARCGCGAGAGGSCWAAAAAEVRRRSCKVALDRPAPAAARGVLWYADVSSRKRGGAPALPPSSLVPGAVAPAAAPAAAGASSASSASCSRCRPLGSCTLTAWRSSSPSCCCCISPRWQCPGFCWGPFLPLPPPPRPRPRAGGQPATATCVCVDYTVRPESHVSQCINTFLSFLHGRAGPPSHPARRSPAGPISKSSVQPDCQIMRNGYKRKCHHHRRLIIIIMTLYCPKPGSSLKPRF
jgi:hypothetical protein